MTGEDSLFRKVLIANRGEIAVRIARTLREMGIVSVAVYSDADAGAAHVEAADEAFYLGPPMPAQSYLNQERLLEIARAAMVDAIQPGYGFLSENAHFARRCLDAGVVFIGPPPDSIETMGNKIAARQAAMAAGVPIVPGTTEPLVGAEHVLAVAADFGYPVAIKAAAGGGGYGMRVAQAAEEIASTLAAVQRDAARAFGETTVYVERFFSPPPRHVEVQVLGDQFGAIVHLGERECSLQRRFQKIVEECPAPALAPALRQQMGDAAVALARNMGYQSAGTVEYLVDGDGQFYFLEMNTRLQVEHPVTEAVTGVDLVREMVRIAAGAPLSIPAAGVTPHGHAIEARVYAEDPARGFLPSPGEITRMDLPSLPQVRVDTGARAGTKVPIYYDPLIAKVIAWGENRDAAITLLWEALAQMVIEGVKTNLPFLRWLVADEGFTAGRIHTRYVDERMAEFMAQS